MNLVPLRPGDAPFLRADRFRKNTVGSALGGIASAVLGNDSEDDSDSRPPGITLSWHDPAGAKLVEVKHHPFDRQQYPALLAELSAYPGQGARVQHAVAGTLVETWDPGAPPFRASLPQPGPPRAKLVELGWTVDFDGTSLRASHEWPAPSGKVARLVRAVKRKAARASCVALQIDEAGLSLRVDDGDNESVLEVPRAELRTLSQLPGAWGSKGGRGLRIITASDAHVVSVNDPRPGGWSTGKTRAHADASREALAALALIAVARWP